MSTSSFLKKKNAPVEEVNLINRPENTRIMTRSIRFTVPDGIAAPWLEYNGGIPGKLDYFDGSMVEAVEASAKAIPKGSKRIAYHFFGNQVTYDTFIQQIHLVAKSLCARGIKAGDRVTICMPNTPQAVIMLYGLNRIGAVANMIHPLSGEEQIVNYINDSKSLMCLTLKQFFPKFARIAHRLNLKDLVICDITDGLAGVKKLLYPFMVKEKVKIPSGANVLMWKDFIKAGSQYKGDYTYPGKSNDVAVILYSGGTTGSSKGILLTNLNFNALALQTGTAGDCVYPGHTMLSIMPLFHGFGLGVCVHTMLYWGCSCILIPQFDAKSYCKLLKQYKPNYIAGVPTLYEALLRIDEAQTLDMSQLEGIFSGGDSLSVELKKKVDAFLTSHGSKEQVREGYGTTECVTASCLTPRRLAKEGSIGVPFPDTYYKVVIPSTHDQVPEGTIGEICISGPTVMLGYMDNPKETAQTLQLHEDGMVWLHTGDLGYMDQEGYVYFKQRLKRMIVTSGYNVYPSQVENAIDQHPDVHYCTVIGVKDDYRMQRVKAFVVLKPGVTPSEELKQSIRKHCSNYMEKFAIPREIEFRDELPKTLVGKVAYRVLEKEEEDHAKR